jgi:hypothetical protein
MKEKGIEQKFVDEVKRINGLAIKLVSPGFSGLPDRLVLIPEGKIGFVEVKAPGKKPRRLQRSRHDQLRKLGFKVFVLDDENQIKAILEDLRR